jgi:carbamoyl-phosphate synthase small subunit
MIRKTLKKSVLILEDGTTFYGKCAGKEGVGVGEICFNTGMTGYQEVFTDPSYYGQVVVTTNVHIGNYGHKISEAESDSMKISGLICKDFNTNDSRYASNGDLKQYFEKENIFVISEIDTRALVSYIRDKGAMNVLISSEIGNIEDLKKRLNTVPSMNGLQLASFVSTKKTYELGNINSKYKIAVLDFGIKNNILKCLENVGFYIKVFPMSTKIQDIIDWGPSGIFLSNGPGDPASMKSVIQNVKKIIDSKIPLFGICLGHQLIAIASGLKTYKMHNGHRGINHPVINLETKKCEVTSQNHGFSIDESSLVDNKNIVVTHRNLNDQTIEGLKFIDRPCFSVQFHPESSPGPHDSRYLFDQFLNNIKDFVNNE